MKKSVAGEWIGLKTFSVALSIALPILSLVTWILTAHAEDSVVKVRVELAKRVLHADKKQTAIVKVCLAANKPPKDAKRPAVNLALVLDRSGSMAGAKIKKAKEGAIEALRRLGSGDVFSLVAYDSSVRTIVDAQHVRSLNEIERSIRRIRSGGSTALFGGVSQGAAEVRKHLTDDYVQRIILLSDGIANVGPSSPNDLKRLGVALRKEGISVTTIGVGLDYNEDLMTGLSQKSDGNSYFVETENDLPRIFAAELGDVLNVVGKDVKVTVIFPDGVKPLRIIGREGRIVEGKAEISLNQLYGGQEKYVLMEVDVPPRQSGEETMIASARAEFENALDGSRQSADGKVIAQFSSDLNDVEKSANISVIRDFELTKNAITQEQAISLADKGKTQAAVDALKRSAGELKEQAKKYNDKDLMKQAETAENEAAQVERQGMTNKYRKILRSKSYQQQNQQMTK